MSNSSAWIGYGPKILVAIQDVNGMTRVYTGIVREGIISINHPVEDTVMGSYVHSLHAGNPSVSLDVEFTLQYHGGQMKTWADIKKPEEINAAQPAIEAD